MDKPDWKGNRRVGHIYRINADGTNQVQLTFGERGESQPALVAGRQDRSPLPPAATPTPTIRSTCSTSTAAKRAASPVIPRRRAISTWAPDGTAIWFAATDAKSAEEREKDRLQDDVYAFEETNFKQRHVWTTDLDGKTKRITDGADFSVTPTSCRTTARSSTTVRAPSPLLELSRLARSVGQRRRRREREAADEERDRRRQRVALARQLHGRVHGSGQRQVRQLLQRQDLPRSGGGRHPAPAPAERHVRGRERRRGPRTASRCSSRRTWACTTS